MNKIKAALLAALCLWNSAAFAQSSPGFLTGQTLGAAQLNSAFAAKSDYPAASSVLAYGAKCDGTTDDLAAFALAMAAGGNLTVPAGVNCYLGTTGVVVPGNATLQGLNFIPSATSLGSRVTCAATAPACVTLGQNDHGTPSLRNLSVFRNGTPASGTYGVLIDGALNVVISNVQSYNQWDGIYFKSDTGNGISAHVDNYFDGKIYDAHMVFDTWPEASISQSRLGMPGDVTAATDIRFTGGDPSNPGAGPNTITFSQVQFNTTATHWVEFVNLNGHISPDNATEFKFYGQHVEDILGAYIYSDSSWNIIDRLTISGITFNSVVPFFALDPGTDVKEWEIVGDEIFASSLVLAPVNNPMLDVLIASNRLLGGISLTCNVFPCNAAVIGNSYGANVTLAGHWGALQVGGAFSAGGLINTTTGNVTTDFPALLSNNATTTDTLIVNTAATLPATTVNGQLTLQANLQSTTGATFNNNVHINGGYLALNQAPYYLNGLAGVTKDFIWQTGSLDRWHAFTDGTAETGGNAGSNWCLSNWNDAGTVIGNVLCATRSTGLITAYDGLATAVVTVSTLPAAPVEGERGYISDATSCTFNSTVTGGGSTACPVVYNGSNWVGG